MAGDQDMPLLLQDHAILQISAVRADLERQLPATSRSNVSSFPIVCIVVMAVCVKTPVD